MRLKGTNDRSLDLLDMVSVGSLLDNDFFDQLLYFIQEFLIFFDHEIYKIIKFIYIFRFKQ